MTEKTYTETEVNTITAALKAKLKRYEEQIQEQTNRFAKREIELKKWRIAMEVGLPLEIADRLSGESEAEIYADARAMLYLMDNKPPTSAFLNLCVDDREAVANSKHASDMSEELRNARQNLPLNKKSAGAWAAFQDYYKNADVRTIMVNNISVRDPDFVKKVMDSARDTNYYPYREYVVNFAPEF